MQELADIFGSNGALAERLPGFSYRESQERMAQLVMQALASGRHAAIEAGTGIGKTFAYLMPVLMSGRRAIISTGTKTLQDQLFARDLPLLGTVVGRPMQVALLKGRNNYLCWHRLETARHDGTRDAETLGALRALSQWGQTSDSGDLTELEDFADDHTLRPIVTSTVENCLGRDCEFFDRCFVLDARRRAQAADIVIVNHHLLLADLALKENGFGELLPGADAVIVDEAHHLPDVARQLFGWSVSTREIESLVRDVYAEARTAAVIGEIDGGLRAVSKAIVDLRSLAGPPLGRIPWAAAPAALRDLVPDVGAVLGALAQDLEPLAEGSGGLRSCVERAVDAAARMRSIAVADASEGLRWVDVTNGTVAVHWTPLDVGAALAARIEAQQGVWVFTSATLAVGDDFSHFLERIGIERPLTSVLQSPFDYANNARIFVPQGLPDPSDELYVETLLAAIWPLLEAARGGAFLLFTSHRALQRAETWIGRHTAPGTVLVQGRGSRSELLKQFRADGNAILLGTGRCWQGGDVRSRRRRVVVI